MIDATLLQALADRLAGIPVNGCKADQFSEPAATLWRDLDAKPQEPPANIFMAWAGNDTDRLDIAAEIFKLTPGAPPPPDPWPIYSLVDAFKVRPPLEYIVADTIVTPSLNAIYGAPGSLKSMLAADMMVCVAGGVTWLQSGDPKTNTARQTMQSPCLWCDFDNGLRRTHERFEALGRAHNLTHSAPLHYVSMPTPWLDAFDKTSINELTTRAKKLNVKMIVIDNLGTISGAADENSHEMIQVMSNLRYLAESANVAVIVLHHQRKGSGIATRAGERLRGHSSIEAALDLALLVEREEHSDAVVVKSTKSRDVDIHPFGAQFNYQWKTGTKEMYKAEMKGIAIEDKTSDTAIKNEILDIVQLKQPITQTDLINAVKQILPDIGFNRIRAAIINGVRSGVICARNGAKNATLYELP